MIDGAIKTAEKLSVSTFAIVAPVKDLAKAETKMCDGWRYKTLPDGTVYIGSIAMQELAISHGIFTNSADAANALAWMQNVCNPRLKVEKADGKVLATIRASLLLRAGDVESNPGPMIFEWVKVVLAYSSLYLCWLGFKDYHPSFASEIYSQLMQVVVFVYESAKMTTHAIVSDFWHSTIGPFVEFYLDNEAYQCAHADYERGWNNWMTGFPVIGRYYRFERKSYWCNMVHKYWDHPKIDFSVFPDWSWLLVVSFSVASMVTLTTCVVVVAWRLTRGVKRVTVVNRQATPFSHTKLKDAFARHANRQKVPDFDGKTHSWLAEQRRSCEAFALNTLLTKFPVVRDVGGSRSRWPELGVRKHVCGPILSNDDILREDKACGTFVNCGKNGEFCPQLDEIPAAMLSHVDYHMTVDQLSRIVTGPTFVINHDFNRHKSVGVHITTDEDGVTDIKEEAKVILRNGLVSMTPLGGTPYTSHPYHHWKSEGSVVGRHGAFTYVRLGEIGETAVYYCHPSNGTYDADELNVLTTSSVLELPVLRGHQLERDGNGDYVLGDVIIPGGLIAETVQTMASAPRDSKYYDTLRSYTQGKIKAYRKELMTHADAIMAVVSYLADVKGVEVTSSSRLWGSPATFRWYHRAVARWWVWGVYFLNHFRLASRNVLPQWAAPWLFTTVRVPTYEKYSEICRVTDGPGLKTTYNRECFPPAPTPAHAGSAERAKHRPSKNQTKHGHVTGNKSTEHVPPHAPAAPPAAPRSRRSSNASSESSDATSSAPSQHSVRESGVRKTVPECQGAVPKRLPNNSRPAEPRKPAPLGPVIVSRSLVTFVDLDDADQGVCVTNRAAKNLYVGRGMRLKSAIERSAARGFKTSTTDLAIDVECVLDRIWEIKPLPNREHEIVESLLGFFSNPTGKFSDKSAYPEGTRVLPLQPGSATPDNFASYPLGDVVVALPLREATAAPESSRKPRRRTKPQGRAGKELHKDRNQRKTRRPAEHLAAE
nr:MAG: hypothetical protein [Ips tombus-like virus 2]